MWCLNSLIIQNKHAHTHLWQTDLPSNDLPDASVIDCRGRFISGAKFTPPLASRHCWRVLSPLAHDIVSLFSLQSATVTAMLSSSIRNTLRVSTFICSFYGFKSGFFVVSWPPLQLRNPQIPFWFFFRSQTGSSRSPLATSNPDVWIRDDDCYLRFHLSGQLHKCASDRAVKRKQSAAVWPRTFMCVYFFYFFLLLLKLKRNTVHFMQELINSRLSKHNEGGRWKEARLCACFCSRAVICLFGQSNTLLRNYHAATSCL